MHYYMLAICALFGLSRAAPSQSNQAINPAIGVPGAFEVPVAWTVRAFPEGPLLQLNGTVQEVYKRLLEINPNYSLDPRDSSEGRGPELTARTSFSDDAVVCDPSLFGWVPDNHLAEGIEYLRSLEGQPRNGGGPGACGRVSCSYGTGIWWCNDSREPKTLESWGSIADGAEMIRDLCRYMYLDYDWDSQHYGEVSGQIFHPTDWNVIVRSNNC